MSFGKSSGSSAPVLTQEQKDAIKAQTEMLTGTIIPQYKGAVGGAADIYNKSAGGVLNATQNLAGTASQAQQTLGETGESALRTGISGLESLFNPDGLSSNQFDTLQKRAYPALVNVTGSCLQDVLDILDCTLPNITTMADLLNPQKLFPTSYPSLTLPTPDGPVLIYDNNDAVSSSLAPILNSGTLSPIGCDQLAKIIPPADAAASRALQIAFQQIKGINNVTTQQLAAVLQ